MLRGRRSSSVPRAFRSRIPRPILCDYAHTLGVAVIARATSSGVRADFTSRLCDVRRSCGLAVWAGETHSRSQTVARPFAQQLGHETLTF